jgi:hypothetical protein
VRNFNFLAGFCGVLRTPNTLKALSGLRLIETFKQGVAGLSPARLMSGISQLGGSKRPAFFRVHTNVHTAAVWSWLLRLSEPF